MNQDFITSKGGNVEKLCTRLKMLSNFRKDERYFCFSLAL